MYKTMIAFRCVRFDDEGLPTDTYEDTYMETAFLFDSEKEVNIFFHRKNPILIHIYCNERDNDINIGDFEYNEDGSFKRCYELLDFAIHFDNSNDFIDYISFNNDFCGNVELHRMSKGIICNNKNNKI